MRKTSYVIAFFAVIALLLINVVSIRRPDWLVVNDPEILHSQTTVRYGLTERCERQVVKIPMPNGSELAYTDYTCRPFPNRVADRCEKEEKAFCMIWSTAGYFSELAAGFAIVSSLAILFGVSTHSRRRRIWRAVAGLTALNVVCQLATFGVVTSLYSNSQFPTFERARPGFGYILNILSWIIGTLVTAGIITTGISANKGHRWAAGNRAYRPIEG